MANKEMEGDNRQRRAAARAARKTGKLPSEEGVTLGGSKQRAEASETMTHQQRIDLMRRAKQQLSQRSRPSARPGSRDPEPPDRET
jgi:hypothetical protein